MNLKSGLQNFQMFHGQIGLLKLLLKNNQYLANFFKILKSSIEYHLNQHVLLPLNENLLLLKQYCKGNTLLHGMQVMWVKWNEFSSSFSKFGLYEGNGIEREYSSIIFFWRRKWFTWTITALKHIKQFFTEKDKSWEDEITKLAETW